MSTGSIGSTPAASHQSATPTHNSSSISSDVQTVGEQTPAGSLSVAARAATIAASASRCADRPFEIAHRATERRCTRTAVGTGTAWALAGDG